MMDILKIVISKDKKHFDAYTIEDVSGIEKRLCKGTDDFFAPKECNAIELLLAVTLKKFLQIEKEKIVIEIEKES